MDKYGYSGDPKFKPLSPWSYFGYNLLLGLPFLGIIFAFIFAFSKKNINRRNFVRSYFIVYIIYAIVIGILFLCLGSAANILQYFSRFAY